MGFGVAVALLSAARHASLGLHVMAFNAVVDSLTVLGIGMVLLTIAWQIAARSRPATV